MKAAALNSDSIAAGSTHIFRLRLSDRVHGVPFQHFDQVFAERIAEADEFYEAVQTLALSEEEDVLIMTYQFTSFRQKSEVGGLMTGFRASDGKRLWEDSTRIGADRRYNYSSRPLINGRVIYLEPGAYNLLTGERLDFSFERSYSCGILTGCKNLLVFRSATMGYLDLTTGSGTENYGGIRPGCWINALPVGGLVIMPDATARCNCSYLNKATIALQPLRL